MSLVIEEARERAARLDCWIDPVKPEPVSGGITNANFRVEHRGGHYFVRIGEDIPVLGVMRFNEIAASRAAHAAGLSPEVVHQQPGALVLRFIDGRTLTPEAVREPEMIERVIDLVRRCHGEIEKHLRGPTLAFCVFQTLRDYSHTLRDGSSAYIPKLDRLQAAAATLEQVVGPSRAVFSHNDLLASNLLDDGKRLWLIDWDYAGWGHPLFDLAGLASNNGLSAEVDERILASYFGIPEPHPAIRRAYSAMKCASLLREALWSMVSEQHSEIAFDYAARSEESLAQFEEAFLEFVRNGA